MHGGASIGGRVVAWHVGPDYLSQERKGGCGILLPHDVHDARKQISKLRHGCWQMLADIGSGGGGHVVVVVAFPA